MSFQDFLLLVILMLTIWISVMKQMKSLLLLIFLEVMTIVVMVVFILVGDSLPFGMIVIFLFFVSESLIILSILYSSMRVIGGVYGHMTFL